MIPLYTMGRMHKTRFDSEHGLSVVQPDVASLKTNFSPTAKSLDPGKTRARSSYSSTHFIANHFVWHPSCLSLTSIIPKQSKEPIEKPVITIANGNWIDSAHFGRPASSPYEVETFAVMQEAGPVLQEEFLQFVLHWQLRGGNRVST